MRTRRRTTRRSRLRVILCVQNLSVPKDPRVWREARSLAAAGFEVHVIAPRDEGEVKNEVLEGVAIHRYAQPRLPGMLGLVAETAVGVIATSWRTAVLRTSGPVAALHAANPPDAYFLLGWLVKRLGGSFVFDVHDASPELLQAKLGDRKVVARVIRWMERRSFRTADVVITTNGSFRRLAIERGGCDPARVVVVRTGPDSIGASPVSGQRVPGRVVFAGVMGEQDGVEHVLRAVASLVGRGRQLSLELVGDGPDRERLHQIERELGIGDIVTWRGWVSREELSDRLGHAQIAVSPDDDSELNRKATMLKVGDYLAAGLPTVASDLPETRVTCGEAVVYVPPGDETALAEAIERLLDDPARRDALSVAARERAQRLLWPPSGERLVATYRWMLEGGTAIEAEQLP